ncbi:MAG: GIY-YIG nuclease family protein [Bacteroidota bacterium]
MNCWVYILRLRSGSLYVGACRNLRRRYDQHLRGKGSRQTALDPPITIAYAEEHPTFVLARRREAQLKRWSRAKKEALIRGDLQELKALARRRGQ